MKKHLIQAAIVLAVVLALFFVLLFAIPFVRGTVFWLSFAFTLLAIGLGGWAVFRAVFQNPDMKSRFYRFPILRLAPLYVVLQLALCLLFCAVGKWVPYWIPLILYTLVLGAALVGLVAIEVVVDTIAAQDQKLKINVAPMRELQSRAGALPGQCTDPALRPELQKLSEAFRFSDPVSSPALEETEKNLSALLDTLQQAVVEGDTEGARSLCARLTPLLAERNRLCRLHKA